MKLKLTQPLVFFDLETTGLNIDKDRIVQIAGRRFPVKGPIQDFNMLLNPECPIGKGATEVHGIEHKHIKDMPTFKDKAQHLYNMFFAHSDWAGYNILNFDVPLLLNAFKRCGYSFKPLPNFIDCFRIFQKQVSHTLAGAVQFYTGEPLVDAHDAMADVKGTVAVFYEQELRGMPDTVEEVYKEFKREGELDIAGKLKSKDGYSTINFGKHNGTSIREVPMEYFDWCYENAVLGPDAWDIIRKVFTGDMK